MKIVLLGPPGVGKGTYAARISGIYGIPHISTGDIFRDAIKKKTELGLIVKSYMDKGSLVPDEVTIRVMKERLEQDDCSNGFLLDGYPRTIAQAEALERAVEIDKVLNFKASDDVIVQRLSGRRICRGCGAIFHVENIKPKKEGVCDKCSGELYQREDDRPESIMKRLEVYAKQTAPLIEFYRNKGKLADIDASRPIEQIEEIISEVKEALA